MLGIHGAWDLVIPLTSTRLGWVSEDRDFVALATVSRDTLRLSGGLAALSEYREYNEERIAQRRAQEERDYQEEQDELDLAVWMVAEEPQSGEEQSE